MARRIPGVVLAGGRSSRMGSEKPLVELGGDRIIERVVKALAPCVPDIVVVTNRPERYGFLGMPLITDRYPGRGPLAGIQAALEHFTCDAALVVACDYPFLEPGALARIARENPTGGIVLPLIGGHLHPLCALYAAEARPVIETSLRNGELKVLSVVARLKQKVLTEDEFGGAAASRTFFNINTPDDLRRAEALLAETQPRG